MPILPITKAHLCLVICLFLMILKQDKNRDVIVAFPDVDPFFISIAHKRVHHNGKPLSRSALMKSQTDSYDHPHLWYSTAEVIQALKLFIASGDELSASNTFRLAYVSFFTNYRIFSNSCVFSVSYFFATFFTVWLGMT